jgi:hypothetical protein
MAPSRNSILKKTIQNISKSYESLTENDIRPFMEVSKQLLANSTSQPEIVIAGLLALSTNIKNIEGRSILTGDPGKTTVQLFHADKNDIFKIFKDIYPSKNYPRYFFGRNGVFFDVENHNLSQLESKCKNYCLDFKPAEELPDFDKLINYLERSKRNHIRKRIK